MPIIKHASKPGSQPKPAFWLVWREGGNSTPHFKHTSEEEAEKEAERLAASYPGVAFYVLPASRYVQAVISTKWQAAKKFDPDKEIPF